MNADNNADNLVQCKIDALLKFNSTIYHQCRKVFRFIFLFSAIALFANPPAAAATDTPSIIVAPGNHRSDTDTITDTITDISSAVSSAPAGTHIQITEGTYLVDNPVSLRTKNIKLSGAGANKTIILAKNANQPVFSIEANGITIERVTINALVGDGPQRASHAILIQEGSERCNISHNKILNTAATAIIGRSASGCSLVGNAILNSGDDGVRLYGDRLSVIDNTITGYFDEALDLALGSNIVVIGNHVANGRIGIVVDDCTNTLVSNNIVENQILQGIVTGTDPQAIVTANTVRNAGNIAYNLHTPKIVSHNLAAGTNKTGFRLTDMHSGIITQNIIHDNENGFLFIDTAGETTTGIKKNITFYDNCEQTSSQHNLASCKTSKQEMLPSRKTAATTDDSIYIFSPSVEIQGVTPADKKRAKNVAKLLKYYNPGFLSIQIDGALMKSEITADFHDALRGAGELGMGLVRAPFLEFSNGQRSFFWYLSVDGKDVAVVSSIYDGPKTRISFLNDDGELSLLNSAILFKDKVLLKLFN